MLPPDTLIAARISIPNEAGEPELITPPEGIPMQVWKVRAFAQLLSHGMAHFESVPELRGTLVEAPDALVRAARALAQIARRCNRARHCGGPPHRLTDIALPLAGSPVADACRLLASLAEAMGASLLVAPVGSERGSDLSERVRHAWFCAHCAACVPPAEESAAGMLGYTSTEFVLDSIANCIYLAAEAFDAIPDGRGNGYRRAAKRARLLAQMAAKMIETGVRHTLTLARSAGTEGDDDGATIERSMRTLH